MTMTHESTFESGPRCQIRSAGLSSTRTSPWDIGCGQFGRSWSWASTFLRPFAPPELPGFIATMNALTPERSALRRPARSGLLAYGIKSSGHSVSNHPLSFPKFGLVSLRDLPPCEPRQLTHPLGRVPHGVTWASPLASKLATTTGRDHRSGGARFVSLRTNHSPSVALHPASRRRSYVRIQSSNPTMMRTRTSLT